MNQTPYRTKGNSRLRHWALAGLLAAGTAGTAHAQLGYQPGNATNTTGTYTDLGTTGAAIATANTDDANSVATPIGFTFTYNGTAYTDFVLNTNGFLKLGTAAPTGPQYTDGGQSILNGPVTGADTDLLLPFNQDLTAGSAGGTEYRVATTGAAGSRVTTIQWKNVSDKARGAFGTQYANFSFQVRLYEGSNQIEFVYGAATAGAAAADVAKFVNVGIKGSTAAASLLATKASSTPWSGTTFLTGQYTANGHNVRVTVLPDPGRTYRFAIPVANDAAVTAIQGYASVIVPASNPITLRATVRNVGTTALSGPVTATLTISGANTYTQTQTATVTATGATALVTFAGISLANVGQNTVTVSVPSDGNGSNNALAQPMETSATTISLATPGAAAASTGLSAGTDGYYAARITLNTARSITSVSALLTDVGNQATAKTSVGESVYGVVLDATTGALLGRSANYTITAADFNQFHTFALNSPVTVPTGDVLVGMAQVASTGSLPFFPFGVQAEEPNRTGTYFVGQLGGGPPQAALAAANTSVFKLPFGAVTAAPANNDIAVSEIQGYGSLAVPVANPVSMRAVVRNAGALATTAPTVVTLTISGANTVTLTQSLPALAVGATSVVNFTGITLTNVGANTVTVTVANDDNNANNTVAQALTTSATRYSYIAGTAPAANALGVPPLTTAARTIAFCGRFTTNAPRDVTAVRAFIYNDPNLLPTAANGQRTTTVYGVVVNPITGAVLARSADYVLTAADLNQVHSFPLSVSVPAGDFLVGLAQVTPIGASTTGVFPMGVQDETPARTGLFYTVNITTATPSAPVDAAANDARFMLEAETAAPATCPVPTALVLTGTTATTASFTFTAAAGATSYQIVYGAQGFTPGGAGSTPSPTFTGTTYTLSGLTGGQTYEFYVRAICSATDQSAYAGPVRGTTACTPPTVSTYPYTQNFDVTTTGQTLPCGITVTDSNNDGVTWRVRGTVDSGLATGNIARSAPNAMVYSYNTTDVTVGGNDWFFTPALATTANTRYRVSFYYRAANGYTEGLEVKYGTAATPAAQTNTLFTNNNITNTTYALASNTSTPAVLDITPAAGTYYVGFHVTSLAEQGFLAVDDITISAGPLATSEALKRAVSVFPNPSNTGAFNLEIHGANAKQGLVVEVTNMLGQRVYTGKAKDNFTNTVDLSSLTSGIYSIKVLNGQEYTQQQISIVK